jgi:GT2 family glycosyltransferase
MLTYSLPDGVKLISIGNRPLLTTPQGGKVAVDPLLLSLWEYAIGRSLEEVITGFKAGDLSPRFVRSGLACLAEAGLLTRNGISPGSGPQPKLVSGPLVAAVIVGYNSREWLEQCLPSLIKQIYSPLAIVVVDNGSRDDTIAWLEAHYPEVICERIDLAVSLAQAINQGASKSPQAEYLLMLNPDIRLEPDAIAQMVAVAESDPQCAAVGAKLRLWWAPAFLNGLGNRVGLFSWGTDNAFGHLDLGQFDDWRELPSACFAAALISRTAWQDIGPLDEGFPMYYEDVEWCYRARLLGYKILVAPRAVVYHAFGGKTPSGAEQSLAPRKLRNVVYGRLRFTLTITHQYLRRLLRNYLLEDWRNFIRYLADRNWASAWAYPASYFDLIKTFPSIVLKRRALQARSVTSDAMLFGSQESMPATFSWNGLPEMTSNLITSHYSPLIRSNRTKAMPEFDPAVRRPHLLIVSNDVIDDKMSGPGMRYLEMARALRGDKLDVTLAAPSKSKLENPGVNLVQYSSDRPGSLQVLVENSDIALITNYMVNTFPFLYKTGTRLVVDLYDPTILENLHYYLDASMEDRQIIHSQGVEFTNLALQIGDFFICGNDRQRDFWLGALAANNRINPLTYENDPDLRKLIDVVGIGFPDRELGSRQPIVRGVHPAVPQQARIILWGGGIWNWLDPLTLIQAWPQVIAKYADARLIFLGTRHPNPLVPAHEMAHKAMALASEIGEMDRSIVFIEWVPYDDREALLNEADIGVSLHPIHIETRYSIRTRMLDYIWARLPILSTSGDITSEWVEQYHLGVVVPPFDVDAVAQGLIELLGRSKLEWRSNFDPLMDELNWSKVVEPLRNYCLEGAYAPDRNDRRPPLTIEEPPMSRWQRAKQIWCEQGTKVLFQRAWRYLKWRSSL